MVEEGAVQDERDERGEPAVSRRRRGLDPVGVHLAQNFNHSEERTTWAMASAFTDVAVREHEPLAELTRVRHF